MKLPFTHGIEIENHLVDLKTGKLIVGEELLYNWQTMFEEASSYLKNLLKESFVPDYIRKKILKIEVATEEKRGQKLEFITIEYKLGKKSFRTNVLGPDPNISQITWLLEIVTPPCEWLEELNFWLEVLYNAANIGLSGAGIRLLPVGINPLETEFRSGLSCGEHHHIGSFSSFEEKISAYNLIRCYIPHLICLTACSPFLNSSVLGTIITKPVEDGRMRILPKNSPKSLRLKFNTGQLGPNSVTYLPWLQSNAERKEFAEHVKKRPPDDRFVDLNPFTDYNTIELRFIDASPFMEFRLALVILLQAICLKAQKLRVKTPKVSSHTLFNNRIKAIEHGLQGKFYPDTELQPEFKKIYNSSPIGTSEASKLFEVVLGLLLFLENEITVFENYEQFFSPIFRIFLGTTKIAPPAGIADILMYQWLQQIQTTKKRNFFQIIDDTQQIFSKEENLSFNSFKEKILEQFSAAKSEKKITSLKKNFKKVSSTRKRDLRTRSTFLDTQEPIQAKKKKNLAHTWRSKTLEQIPLSKLDVALTKRVSSRRIAPPSVSAHQKKIHKKNSKKILLPTYEVLKKEFTEYVRVELEDNSDTAVKGTIITDITTTKEIINKRVPLIVSENATIQTRLAKAMLIKREKAAKKNTHAMLEEREKKKRIHKLGKAKLTVIPQTFDKQWLVLLQFELSEHELKEFVENTYYMTLTFSIAEPTEKKVFDFGPYHFDSSEECLKYWMPLLFSTEDLPRETPIRLEFRTQDMLIIFQEECLIPKAITFVSTGITIEEFLLDDTIGPVNMLARLSLTEPIAYKGTAQIFYFSQIGWGKIWEKKFQNKKSNVIQINERFFIPPNIHVGRVILGLYIEEKNNLAIWKFLEFLPRKAPIVEWNLIGVEGISFVLEQDTKYQFLPVVTFHAVLREPEVIIFLIELDEVMQKKGKKMMLKEKFKDITYLGMLKSLKPLEIKTKDAGRYQLAIEIKTRDGEIPKRLIKQPFQFSVRKLVD